MHNRNGLCEPTSCDLSFARSLKGIVSLAITQDTCLCHYLSDCGPPCRSVNRPGNKGIQVSRSCGWRHSLAIDCPSAFDIENREDSVMCSLSFAVTGFALTLMLGIHDTLLLELWSIGTSASKALNCLSAQGRKASVILIDTPACLRTFYADGGLAAIRRSADTTGIGAPRVDPSHELPSFVFSGGSKRAVRWNVALCKNG